MAVPGSGLITDALGGMSGWAFDKIAAGIAAWVVGGVAYFTNGVLSFLATTARPQVDANWFAGPGSPFAVVRNIAGVLMVGFALLGLLQGLVRGDPGAMIRRIGADVPMAVLGIAATVVVTSKLLDLTDALSSAVLTQGDGRTLHFLGRFAVLGLGTQGFAVVVVALLAIVAALLLWIELMVRAALVYLLVAVSPLAFAAMVWPAARGVLRRTAHLLLAVIVSKFVIAVALAVGVAALAASPGSGAVTASASGFGPPTAGASGDPAAGLGVLLVGAVILALAAFAPFIVLRLIPIAEAAVAAQGVSRGPARATQSALGSYYYAHSLGRLGGASPGSGALPVATGATPNSVPSAGGSSTMTGGVAAEAASGPPDTARSAGRAAASTGQTGTTAPGRYPAAPSAAERAAGRPTPAPNPEERNR